MAEICWRTNPSGDVMIWTENEVAFFEGEPKGEITINENGAILLDGEKVSKKSSVSAVHPDRAKGTIVVNEVGCYAFTRDLIGYDPIAPDLLEPIDDSPPVPTEREDFLKFLNTLVFKQSGATWRVLD